MLFFRRVKRLMLYRNSINHCRCSSNKSQKDLKDKFRNGPSLKDFIVASSEVNESTCLIPPQIPYLMNKDQEKETRKIFFDVYGCQMNLNDTEIVWSILKNSGFKKTDVEEEADIFLVMTCAVREGAESKIWHRLDHLRGFKRRRALSKNRHKPVKIGILGCMAERLKEKLIEKEKAVDVGKYVRTCFFDI